MTSLRDPLRAALAAIVFIGSGLVFEPGLAFAGGPSGDLAGTRLDRLTIETEAALAKLPHADPRLAQNYGYPPADVGGEAPYQRPQQDSAGLLVRIDRLENQMRQINGQIEQLQFGARRIEEQIRKFQEDVDFRFQDSGGRGTAPAPARPLQKRTDLNEDPIEPDAAAPQPAPGGPSTRPGRRSDAFDPSKAPAAPGAPRALGTSSALPADTDAPLDLTGGRLSREAATPGAPPPQPGRTPATDPIAALTAPGAPGDITATNPVKAEFDAALGLYKQKQYESAEKGFAAFLQKNSKSKMAPDAVYFLGETFFARGRHREAAEQYLKFSTQYPNAPRAPESYLRLGQSLMALGGKEQACAAFGEVNHKYPAASAATKAGAEREAKRAQC